MVGGDPVEPRNRAWSRDRASLPHEVADEGLQVAELGAVLSGNDEAELVAIVGAAFEERLAVGIVGRRTIEAARFFFVGDAVALDVAKMRPRRAEIGPPGAEPPES